MKLVSSRESIYFTEQNVPRADGHRWARPLDSENEKVEPENREIVSLVKHWQVTLNS